LRRWYHWSSKNGSLGSVNDISKSSNA